MFTLRLLGPFDLRVGPRTPALRRKERALLAYLVATQRPHTRRALADIFCQEADVPERTLRLLLSRIRQEVHSQAILSEDETLRYNPHVGWVDYLEFAPPLETDLYRLTLAALDTTVDLYRGEFLAGLTLTDAPEFDLWVLAQQARLRRLYERGLTELIARRLAHHEYEPAIQRAHQLIQSNPLLEEGHARLIWLYAQTGQREAALAQYAHISALLRRELAVEPSPELVMLRDTIAAGRVGPGYSPRARPRQDAPTPAPAVDFVGREPETARLRTAWEAALAGRGSVLLVEAQAGGGKTRLVQEFGRGLPEGCFLHGRCYESTLALPYHPWIEIIEARCAGLDETHFTHSPLTLDYLLRLAPTLGRRFGRSVPPALPTTRNEHERLFTAVADCLSPGSAPDQPAPRLLVFVDDLQWADETSLHLFHFIARRASQTGLLLIGAYRSDEAEEASALQSLLHDLSRLAAHRLVLPPLSANAIDGLITQLWTLLPAGYRSHVAAMLSRATGGNPLFITEVLSDLAHLTDAPAELPVPASVRELVSHRLRRLPDSSRQVIEALAVWHAPATLAEAQHISGRSEDETAEAIDLGLRRGLLHPLTQSAPTRYDFHHDLVREAVIGRVSQVRRELLHRRVALSLEQTGAKAALLAYHWGKAGELAQEGRYAALAGEQAAAVYANDEAVRYLERALALIDDVVKRLEILKCLGEVRMLTGQWQAAEYVFRQALVEANAIDSRHWQARFQHQLGILMSRKGLYPEALEWLTQAAANGEASGDRAGQANALGTMGIVSFLMDDYATAFTYYQQALHIDTELGNRAGVAIWLGNIGNVHHHRGAYAEALASYEASLKIIREVGNKAFLGVNVGNVGNVYRTLRDFPHALAYHQEALQIRHELGDRAGVAIALGNLGRDYEDLGELDAALACFQTAMSIDLTLGGREGMVRETIRLGQVLGKLGRLADATQWLERGMALARQLGAPSYLGSALLAQAQTRFALGEFKAAQPLTDEALGVLVDLDQDLEIEARSLAIRLQVALGELSLSAAHLALAELLPRQDTPLHQATIQYEMWRLDRSQDTLRQAAAALYQKLWQQTPSGEVRQRYAELTGETLPAPPSVVDLPALVTTYQGDLTALLAQVDQHLASLAA